jgi:hypothetical protein
MGPGYPEITTINQNKKEETNMLFACSVMQAKRSDKAAALYDEEEVLIEDTKIAAGDTSQATLLIGAQNAETILKAREEKSKLRVIVRNLG